MRFEVITTPFRVVREIREVMTRGCYSCCACSTRRVLCKLGFKSVCQTEPQRGNTGSVWKNYGIDSMDNPICRFNIDEELE